MSYHIKALEINGENQMTIGREIKGSRMKISACLMFSISNVASQVTRVQIANKPLAMRVLGFSIDKHVT